MTGASSSRARGGTARRRVAVVTGGGGGIGRAAAFELAREGAVVVAMDPGVGVQGEPLGEQTAAETVKQIVAAGGTARASTISVTDGEEVRSLFQEVVGEFGSLDIVINAAGILRFSHFLEASEDDWRAVLDVHLGGYLNVLSAALPLMIKAGYGRLVGFTSGVGLARTSVAGPAYGCAKRAIAALTWQLGPLLPEGVTANALSPIAASRMVQEAMLAAGTNPNGLDLSAMPQPDDMGPAAAYLASDAIEWCRGEVLFSAGSEISVIAPPRLMEGIRTRDVADFASALGTIVPVVLNPVEAQQNTTGGSNPRFGAIFDEAGRATDTTDTTDLDRQSCVIVSDDPDLARALGGAVTSRGMRPVGIGPWRPFDELAAQIPSGFAAIADTLTRASQAYGPIAAVVVVLGSQAASSRPGEPAWQELLEAHVDTIPHVIAHAGWLRAATDHASRRSQPIRITHLTDANSASGRTGAQAVAQMARSANDTPLPVQLDAFAISIETAERGDDQPLADLVARLVRADDTRAMRGAELVVRPNWIGLRSHPSPIVTVSFGGRAIPAWVDDALKEVIAPHKA